MKRIAVAAMFVCLWSANGLSQGQVQFIANPTVGLIEYTIDGINVAPIPTSNPGVMPGYGVIRIAMMAAPDGTQLSEVNGLPNFTSAWAQSSVIGPHIIIGGRANGTLTLPASAGPEGANAEVCVIAWAGDATTWQDAISGGANALGFSGSILSGGALEWSQATGNPDLQPIPMIPAPLSPEFQGLVLQPIQEFGLSAVPDQTSALILAILSGLTLFPFSRKRVRRN